MNHKRHRPKHQRQGCSCKYWKDERYPRASMSMQKASDRRHLQVQVPRPEDAHREARVDAYVRDGD